MDKALPNLPIESFAPPAQEDTSKLKPVLRGEIASEPHSILYWVEKDNPRSQIPSNPASDSQFQNWEYGVKRWALSSGYNSAPTAVTPAPITETTSAGYIPLPVPNGF